MKKQEFAKEECFIFSGIKFYSRYLQHKPFFKRTQSFFNGFIKREKVIDELHSIRYKKYQVGRVVVAQWGYEKGEKYIQIFCYTVWHKPVTELLYKQIQHKIPPNTDYIFILNSNLGELFCFFCFCSKAYFAQNHIKNPLFLITKTYHRDLCRLFYPQAPIVMIPHFRNYVANKVFQLNQIHGLLLFTPSHFVHVEENIIQQKGNWFDILLQYLSVKKEDTCVSALCFSNTSEISLSKKITPLSLNMEKLVILSPEANSCLLIPVAKWQELAVKLRQRGWSIFFNVTNMPSPDGITYPELSLDEVLLLAQKAKCVVGLRSGLLDLISAVNPNLHIIYTGFQTYGIFNTLTPEQVKTGFDLKYLPNCKGKIKNYVDNPKLISQIIDNLNKKLNLRRSLAK